MTLSEQIISQALSGGWGAGESLLTRRRREREKKVEKRADLLARPDLLQKRVADVAQTLSLSTRKLRTRKYGSKLEALEAQSKGTPQEGFASELLSEYTAALGDPKYIDVSERQLLAGVTETLMTKVPGEKGKTRLEKAHRYKWRADTGLGNIFGLFGEDKSVRKLPGYEGWKAEEKVKPTDEWRTGPVEAAAIGAGWTAALMMGSRILGRTAMFAPIPGARIVGAALMAIPEFMAIDAVRNVLHKTEWARAREGSWKAYVPATIGLVGGGVGARKVITSTIKKAAEKSVFSKGMTELLMKDPTAANAIRAGEAQKVAKVAQARVDRVMLKYINREDALKSQFRTAEDYLGAVKGKTRGELAKIDVGAGERWAAYKVGRIGELRRKVAKIDVRATLKEQKAGMVKGLEFAEIGAAEKAAKKARGSGAILLDAFQEASGKAKPISRKKAAKVFTKELSDEGTEAALKKAGKTGDIKGAVVEQKRVQDLAKKQAGRRVPEKSKVAVSRERGEARKKKKLQDKISDDAVKITKVERLELIKKRAGVFKKRKEGAKVIAEAEPGPESIGKEFRDTISLEEAGLVETFKGGVEESMGGFADDTARDLVELFKDSDRLFGAGAIVAGSAALASLFSPDSAEAAGFSKVGVQVPKVIAGVLKKASGRKEMLKLAKDMKDAGLLHIPIAKGAKEVKYVQSTISTAKLAVEKNNNLIRNIKADTTPFGNWLTARLSPYTTGNILWDINPIPEVGNLQSAIGNNVMNFLKATGNIFRGVPGLISKKTAGTIEKAMAPLAKKYSKNVIAYRAVETEIEKLEKPLKKLYRALKKEGGAQHLPAIEKIEAKRASLLVARKELGPIFNKFTKDWEGKMKELAPKHPTTRVALACEDTAEYVKYPWLKSLMKPEEKEAVIWLKNIFESYKGRMAVAGHDVIEGPYCHHALHPDWLEKGAKEVLEGFALDSKAIPFTKFFHRAKYSKMMMPDINYTMQKYILDAERRIQWSKFWGKGQKNSWYAHRRWIDTYGTEQQKMFWKRLSDAAVPPAPTKANVAANIYSSFEVLRLLGASPSVALKHYFKNIGTMSTMGAGNFASHLPEAITTAIRGAKVSPEMKSIYKLIGVKNSKGKRKVFDEVADSFIAQIHRMNMIADLDFEAVIPHKAGFWRAFTEKMQNVNRWGSIPVRMIESVDRHHTILAAWEAGAKKGMTAQQAIYGIYNNILRLNFLSGACNPAWVRNPKIRAMLLFQNTAFKIMERRLIVAWRAGKDVKTALGVVRHQDIQKTLKEMTGIGKYILGAEKEMKQNMIFDALTSTKGFFGTPVIKQAMTEAILSGAIIMGGGIAGMNLTSQVWHIPFLRHGAKAPTLAVNPFLNAIFRTAGEREEAEEYGIEKDFMVLAMTRNWLKSSGYLPQTANKLVRISKQDIPEIYAGSKWSYFFSVPAKEEY